MNGEFEGDDDHSASVENEYIPGKCNIGIREIRRRQLIGGIGLFLTISTVFGYYHQHASEIARLGTFLPALVMSIGYLQARKKFCLAFAFSGLFNFGGLGQSHNVISKEDRTADRKAAINLLLQASALACLVTALVFLLPISHK